MLNVDNSKGLTDILKGTATLQEAITRAAGSNLSILTVGRSADGAIDLLNSARMEAVLAELKAIFDIIILDSSGPSIQRIDPRRLGGKDHLCDPPRMDHAPQGVLRNKAATALWVGYRRSGVTTARPQRPVMRLRGRHVSAPLYRS